MGDISIILNGADQPLCIIETTEITIKPMNQVDEQFAYDEGEGDRTIAYWKAAHERFFRRLCDGQGWTYSDENAGCLRTLQGDLSPWFDVGIQRTIADKGHKSQTARSGIDPGDVFRLERIIYCEDGQAFFLCAHQIAQIGFTAHMQRAVRVSVVLARGRPLTANHDRQGYRLRHRCAVGGNLPEARYPLRHRTRPVPERWHQ